MNNLGKRIAVVGVSASGKSIFARKLADKTGLPVTHIDTVMWKSGWNYIGNEETLRQLKEISLKETWIIEGFIDKNAFDAVLNSADSIIYLDYSSSVAAWRYIMRWLKHHKNPRPELQGSPEKFSFDFLKRVWDKKEVYHLNKFLKQMSHAEKIIRLRNPGEAKTLIQTL